MQTPQQRQELPGQVWEPQAVGPRWPLRVHRERGTVRACYSIPHVLWRQEKDMRGARREDDESGRVEWSG